MCTLGKLTGNRYFERDGYMVGLTSKGTEFFFDKEDLDVVQHFTWRVNQGYVKTHDTSNGHQTIQLHRMILKLDDSKIFVDHINGNPLDNRKSNLRICNRQENSRNRGAQKDNKSGYKGVSWHKQHLKWYASIVVNQKHIFLGLFHDKSEASKAYNEAAIKYFGEFAKLNEVI